MNKDTLPWIAVFILAYCIWISRDTFEYWQERFLTDVSFLCFIIWCIPILFKITYPNPIPLFIALALAFLGSIGEVHLLQNLALGFAIGSFYPFSWLSVIWMLCSISWAPSFVWLAAQFTSHMQILKFLIAFIPVAALLGKSFYQRKAA